MRVEDSAEFIYLYNCISWTEHVSVHMAVCTFAYVCIAHVSTALCLQVTQLGWLLPGRGCGLGWGRVGLHGIPQPLTVVFTELRVEHNCFY